MQVEFASQKLRRAYETRREATRQFGEVVGRKYVERINILKSVRERNDLRKMPALRLHEYKGTRKGHFGINLRGNMRLVVSFLTTSTVLIESVEDPHGR